MARTRVVWFNLWLGGLIVWLPTRVTGAGWISLSPVQSSSPGRPWMRLTAPARGMPLERPVRATSQEPYSQNDTQDDRVTDSSRHDSLERREWLKACARCATAVTAGYGTSRRIVESRGASVAWALEATEPVLSLGNQRRNLVATQALCDPTVSVWRTPGGRSIVLLGTAHISQVSAELAGTLVRDIRPDAVFVELDIKRIVNLGQTGAGAAAAASASDTSLAATTPSVQVVIPKIAPSQYLSSSAIETSATTTVTTDASSRAVPPPPTGNWLSRGAMNLASAAVGNAVKGMYSSLSSSGFQPGEEFAMAIRAGQDVGAAVVLGDQDVQVTLRRLTQALAATDLNQLLSPNSALEQSMNELLPAPPATVSTDSALFKEELTAYVERMKSRESVRKLMKELNEVAPALVQVMLTERDAYMAAGLDSLSQFNCIVAVMGIAHQDGVERNLRERGWTPLPLQCV